MTEKVGKAKPPQGFSRLLFRAPIYLFRLRLGWLLGKRFLLLNHVGRKSGQARQAVLEVAKYDKETDTYFVAAGFGKKSDWYQNLLSTPDVAIQVGRRKMSVTAVPLTPEESGEVMVDYAHRHPGAARSLMKYLVGMEVDGSDESYYRVGHDIVPFVALRPRRTNLNR